MESASSETAHIIQLAVAPVFLLTGVAGLLSVMAMRLGRVIDRARVIHVRYYDESPKERQNLDRELVSLQQRARIVNTAISLVTVCALLVCSVIALLFLGEFFGFDSSVFIGWTFILAMLSLIGGLLIFLREIGLATSAVRFDLPARQE